jgi:hypothetical protein
MFVTKVVMACAGLLILLGLAGLVRFGPMLFILSLAAALGSVALFGSTRSTRELALETIRQREVLRAKMIDELELRSAL